MDSERAAIRADLNTRWVIWSNQHAAWWKPEGSGYTTSLLNAGTYSERDAKRMHKQSRSAAYSDRLTDDAMTLDAALDRQARYAGTSGTVMALFLAEHERKGAEIARLDEKSAAQKRLLHEWDAKLEASQAECSRLRAEADALLVDNAALRAECDAASRSSSDTGAEGTAPTPDAWLYDRVNEWFAEKPQRQIAELMRDVIAEAFKRAASGISEAPATALTEETRNAIIAWLGGGCNALGRFPATLTELNDALKEWSGSSPSAAPTSLALTEEEAGHVWEMRAKLEENYATFPVRASHAAALLKIIDRLSSHSAAEPVSSPIDGLPDIDVMQKESKRLDAWPWWFNTMGAAEAGLSKMPVTNGGRSSVDEWLDGFGLTGDFLGERVREAWVRWAKRQPNPKPHWLASWSELGEADRQADREIGRSIACFAIAYYSGSGTLQQDLTVGAAGGEATGVALTEEESCLLRGCRASVKNWTGLDAATARLLLAAFDRVSAVGREATPRRYDQVPMGCWVAALAGITGIPHEELSSLVPVNEMTSDEAAAIQRWHTYHDAVCDVLRRHGWTYVRCGPNAPRGYAIGIGRSARGVDHSVIVRDGELWHDPHPSRDGVTEFTEYELPVRIVSRVTPSSARSGQ